MSDKLRDAISILPDEDLDRLSQGATAEECTEALSDYAIKLEAERDALKAKLDKIKQVSDFPAKTKEMADYNSLIWSILGGNRMNYSELTDPEINKLVNKKRTGKESIFVPDYCNNPSDAWPIILENRIEIHPRDIRVSRNEYIKGWGALPESCSESYEIFSKDKNPLRAAMICFLMMGDE